MMSGEERVALVALGKGMAKITIGGSRKEIDIPLLSIGNF